MSSEKILEKKLKDSVTKLGGLAVKLFSPSFTGLPDRMILLPQGRIMFVELKSTGKTQSKRQIVVSAMLAKLCFPTHLIDTTEKLDQLIELMQPQ